MLDDSATAEQLFPDSDGHEWPMIAQTEIIAPKLPGDQSWPKISIVTPSYNQGSYLEKTIRSVLLQGYPQSRIHHHRWRFDRPISGNHKKYESWIDFWASEKDRGQSHAINKGFARVSGGLLGWLNSDDWYTPGGTLQTGCSLFRRKSIGAVYGQGTYC